MAKHPMRATMDRPDSTIASAEASDFFPAETSVLHQGVDGSLPVAASPVAGLLHFVVCSVLPWPAGGPSVAPPARGFVVSLPEYATSLANATLQWLRRSRRQMEGGLSTFEKEERQPHINPTGYHGGLRESVPDSWHKGCQVCIDSVS